MSKHPCLGVAVAVVAALATAGCQPPEFPQPADVHNAEEAANVYVSAYPAVAWSDIVAKLSPGNNLTIDQARQLAAVTTEAQAYQFLSEFAAGLGLGFAQTLKTTTTTTAASGAQTTTGSRTETSGTVPASSGSASTPLSAASAAPSLTGIPAPLGVDGSTILTAGTALYQQAQILDNQIANAILPPGYQAHLVTIQVNLQPKQRNVRYDAYTDVTLLPGNRWKDMVAASQEVDAAAVATPPVVVYPLVIMDALETTNVARTIQAIQQAALSLSAMLGSTGINAQAGGGMAASNAVSGLDKNSLVTVGRINDYTVRIRLGAENSGSVGLSLVPRVYNISLVVLTRWGDSPATQIRSLQAITHTEFVSAVGSQSLRSSFSGPEFAQRIRRVVKQYRFKFKADECNATPPAPAGPAADRCEATPMSEDVQTAFFRFLRAADRGDYQAVAAHLDLANLDVARELSLRRLLAELVELQATSRYATIEIRLNERRPARLPDPGQLVLYADDGKQATTAILRGGVTLDAKALRAALLVQSATEGPDRRPRAARRQSGTWLASSAITAVGDGAEIAVTFPSLSQAGLEAAPRRPLFLCMDSEHACSPEDSAAPNNAWYAVRATKTAAAVARNPVTASTTTLVADVNSTAQVTLRVGATPSGVTGPLSLAVEGADVRGPAMTTKGIVLAGAPVTLQLGNLAMGTPVKVTTLDKNGKPVGDPILFTVLPPLAAGK